MASATRSVRSTTTGRYVKKTPRGRRVGEPTEISQRAGFVITMLGGVTATSQLIGVSKSQPSRWSTGEEAPSPEKARELLDLDHVLARANLLWGDRELVVDWLTGANAYLGGATPLEVIRTRGVNEVVAALDEAASGAYA